ncbi:beta-glucosidase 12-like [Asparagus officinalis]|nr:beta-glucosidase 12-like [Asparagus officinalis]
MKDTGLDAFRFSISWTRILPNGKISGGINKEGVEYYNNFINELLSRGIKPLVTIFHWDSPQSLEAEYGGFLSPRIVEDFKNYAELLFKLYGDRVKSWITFNEPYSFCQRGYGAGIFAPGRCSSFLGCAAGDSAREPYVAGHNLLLAHAAAVKVYRDKYQASQKGKIGITLVTHWFRPYSNSKADYDASIRALDFFFGWFMDPIATGDYPFTMRAVAGDRLPKFTPQQSKMLRGSYDFLGLNYYTTQYARSISFLMNKVNFTIDDDIHAFTTGIRNGKPIGEPTGSDWLLIYPQGIRSLVLYIKEKYNNPIIYITENGVDTLVNSSIPLKEVLNDDIRIRYLQGHLLNLNKAIGEGANVQGYFHWSMFDSFEWDAGYTVRFGLYYVDFKTLQRLPKKSSRWYRNFLSK